MKKYALSFILIIFMGSALAGEYYDTEIKYISLKAKTLLKYIPKDISLNDKKIARMLAAQLKEFVSLGIQIDYDLGMDSKLSGRFKGIMELIFKKLGKRTDWLVISDLGDNNEG